MATEELLNPPRERILYQDPARGYYISLVNNEEGVWIRFKAPGKESCIHLPAEGPLLQEVLEDFVDHLGLETPS